MSRGGRKMSWRDFNFNAGRSLQQAQHRLTFPYIIDHWLSEEVANGFVIGIFLTMGYVAVRVRWSELKTKENE